MLVLKPSPSSSPALERMVPVSADIYATAFLNPPVSQKMNLLQLAHKFPELKTDKELNQKVDDTLNQVLKGWGLSASQDVRPWLGGQLGLAAHLGDGSPSLLLVDAKDEGKGRAALAKLRNSDQGRQRTWRDGAYGGITVSVGKPASAKATDTIVYTFVERTVVLGNSEVLLHDVIDAAHGKKARLVDSTNYRSIIGPLPREKLVLVYVNGKPVADRLRENLMKVSQGVRLPIKQLDALDAFQGLGFTLVARANGLATDLEISVDSAKLDPQTRSALSAPSRKNATMAWVPRRAYGFLATTNLKQSIQSLLGGSSASTRELKELEEYGLTGPNGVLAHLTGDAALEVGAGAGPYPAGALVLGTDDGAGLRKFLDQIVAAYLLDSRRSGSAHSRFSKTYQGVEITSVVIPELNPQSFMLAYAVTGQLGIIASSPQELQSVIDAGQTGKNIATAELFIAAAKEVHPDPTSVLYLDITETAAAVAGLLPPKERKDYDTKVTANTGPMKAFTMTAQNGPERISQRSFLLIS